MRFWVRSTMHRARSLQVTSSRPSWAKRAMCPMRRSRARSTTSTLPTRSRGRPRPWLSVQLRRPRRVKPCKRRSRAHVRFRHPMGTALGHAGVCRPDPGLHGRPVAVAGLPAADGPQGLGRCDDAQGAERGRAVRPASEFCRFRQIV